MGLPTFMAALAYERHRVRRQERERLLDEQAERQRLRAPEPELEYEPELELEPWYSERTIRWLAMIPVLPLAILAVVLNPWIFWIGLLVLCAVIGVAVAWSES